MKKRNRIKSFILALVILLTSVPIHTLFAKETQSGQITETAVETSTEGSENSSTTGENTNEIVNDAISQENKKEPVSDADKQVTDKNETSTSETDKKDAVDTQQSTDTQKSDDKATDNSSSNKSDTTNEKSNEDTGLNIQPKSSDGGEKAPADDSNLTSTPIPRSFRMASPMALPSNALNSVELIKTNQDGSEKLKGAVFGIYYKGSSLSNLVSSDNYKTVASNTSGSIVFSDLVRNTYYEVRELYAPSGYLPTEQKWDVFVDANGRGYIAKKGELNTGDGAQEKITTSLPAWSIITDNNGTNIGSAIASVNTNDNTFTQIIYVNRYIGSTPPYLGSLKLNYNIYSDSAITNVTSVEAYKIKDAYFSYISTLMPTSFNPDLSDTRYYEKDYVNVSGAGISKSITFGPNTGYINNPYIIKIMGTYNEKSTYPIRSTSNIENTRYGYSYLGNASITTTVNMTPSAAPSASSIEVPNTATSVSITRQNSSGQVLNTGKINIYVDTNRNDSFDSQDTLVHSVDTSSLPNEIIGKFDVGKTYFVKEEIPPIGYALNTNVYEFKINSNYGNVIWGLDKDTTLSKNGTITLTSVVQPAQLIVNKVDENNKPLTGATFRVTSDTGYSKEISGANLSQFKFDNLIPGNYRIEEIEVPDTFVQPLSYWVFKVEKDESGVFKITSPDFPMNVETDSNVEKTGDFAENYLSLYADLVRNENPHVVDIMRGSTKVGTISKQIVGHESDNAYKMEVILKAEPGQTITAGTLTDVMGDHFNVSLGHDGIFTRDDYSMVASDGSFYYIEFDGSKFIKGVYGGEPFGTNRVLDGAELTYDKSSDQLVATGLKVSNGQSIKLTYGLEFDEKMTNGKNTFYWTGNESRFSGTSNGMTTGLVYLARPTARPIVNNLLEKAEISVINNKERATYKFKKVGKEKQYNADGKAEDKLIALQGAQFELFKSSVNDVSKATTTKQKAVSDYDGIVEFDNLQRDYRYYDTKFSDTYYWVKEISAPTGYQNSGEMIGPFKIKYDGTIEYLGDIDADDSLTYDGTLYNIENKRKLAKGDLQINKMINDESRTPLAGTEFTLFYIGEKKPDISNTSSEFWTKSDQTTKAVSDDKGIVKFTDITEGYYRLEETKPTDGYIKSDKIFQVQVDENGITTIAEFTKTQANALNTTTTTFNSLNRSMFRSLFTSFAATADIGASANAATVSIPPIPSTEIPGLYPAGINPRKSNSTVTAPYAYTTRKNYTGFVESYSNPDYLRGLYQFDGAYKGQTLKNVAGVNKYILPTGVPGEYEVHLKVSGNRVTSKTGVVVVLDNSNSMRQTDANGKSRLQAANEATKSFLTDLLSLTDQNVKAALVTYGTDLFDTYSYPYFTNDSSKLIEKLPTTIPTDRGQSQQGGTYTQIAIEKAQELLNNSGFDNKIIVTITDGVPTFSKVISGIDANGKYTFTTTKIGTGNRFVTPYYYSYRKQVVSDGYYLYYEYNSAGYRTGYLSTYNSGYPYGYVNGKLLYNDGYGYLTTRNTGSPYMATYNAYDNYWVQDKTKKYDNSSDYAQNTQKLYYNGTSIVSATILPNNGYGYKLINNHGYATIGQGTLIKDTGTQMYTIGIQIGDSTISGTTTPDAKRSEELEVMFGISSSKNNYFDAQNLDNISTYLTQILAQVEELNPPTVNGGGLIDPMGEMVTLQMGSIQLKDSGDKPIDSEVMAAIERYYSDNRIELNNINLSKDQEIELIYKVNLKTEDPNFVPGKMYDTNGRTTLQPNSKSTTIWDLPLPKISAPSISIDISKIWQNADGTVNPDSSESIQVKLQKKIVGEEDSQYIDDPLNGTKTLTKDGNWKQSYTNLIPFDNSGRVYEYRIIETSSNGNYSVLYEGNGGNRNVINREVLEYDFVNTQNEIDFIKKDIMTQEPLQDVVFQLRKDGEIYKDPYNPDRDYGDVTSDSNGKIFFERLVPGQYELIEIKKPTGFETPKNPVKTFTVGIDGKITQSGREITKNDPFKTIYNVPVIVPVKIVKIDGDNHDIKLQGAQFKLYGADGVTEVVSDKIYTSDVNGIVDFGELRAGNYFIKEISAPKGGYNPVPGLLSLIVQENGKINFNGTDEISGEGKLYHELTNYKEKTTEIGVQKLKKNADGSLSSISGAKFEIKNIDGSEITPQPGRYTNYTDASKVEVRYGIFTGLTSGKYRIDEELSPVGYIRFAGHYTFEIVESKDSATGKNSNSISWIRKHSNEADTTGILIYENGKILSPNDLVMVEGSDGSGKANTIAIKIVNEPNKLVFEKIDGDTKQILPNVKFALYYEVPQYEEDTFYREDGTEVKLRAVKENRLPNATDPSNDSPVVRTTNSEGKIIFEALPHRNPDYELEEIKFYLKEVEGADGYQVAETVYGPFTATEDGIKGPDGKVINSNEILEPQPVQIKNYIKPDLQITKVDSKDNSIKLDGVEFELYRATESAFAAYNPKEEAEATGIKQTTQNGGVAMFKDIEAGVYWLKETISPKGYVKNKDLIGPYLVENGRIYKVEIDQQGKIKADSKQELTHGDTAGLFIETIKNIKAVYPKTGGFGTRYFYLFGLLLMTIGYYINRKQRYKDSTTN